MPLRAAAQPPRRHRRRRPGRRQLLELLDKVGATKLEQLQASVVPGDYIAFEGVDIITPAEVTLVKNLSFKLEQGAACSRIITSDCVIHVHA